MKWNCLKLNFEQYVSYRDEVKSVMGKFKFRNLFKIDKFAKNPLYQVDPSQSQRSY